MSARSNFVGRTQELAKIASLLRNSTEPVTPHVTPYVTPYVTLWGPGGAGKSALAAVASGDGAVIVDLAAARATADVVEAFAVALDVALDDAEAALAVLARAAKVRGAVVVADSAEQLGAGARRVLRRIAEDGVRVIVTSRIAPPDEPEDEARAVYVGPLDEEAGLALYTGLAGVPADEDARAIVRRLDALPLALELAAARARLLGSRALAERLGHLFLGRVPDFLRNDAASPSRHATLRAALAWSWDMLDDRARRALVACATFEDAFDAPLVLRVLAPDGDPDGEWLDALDRLRQHALLGVGAPDDEGRPSLSLLATVRDFARAEEQAETRRRYAEAMVERTEPLADIVREGGAVPAELARRRRDLARVSALEEPELAPRATLSLAALLAVTGPLSAIAPLVDRVRGPRRARFAFALTLAKAEALRAMGRLDEAAASADEARGTATSKREEADARRVAGSIARSQGDAALAIAELEAALAHYREESARTRARVGQVRSREVASAQALASLCIGELGAARQTEGDLAAAIALHAEAIALLEPLGRTRAEGVQRSYLALATHRRGDPGSALPLHQGALAIHRRVGHRRLEGAELLHLGFVHHELGAPAAAMAAFDEARRVLGAAGAIGLEALAAILEARLDVDEGRFDDARIALAGAGTRAGAAPQSSNRGWSRLEATRRLVSGHLAFALGEPARAAREYEAALAASRDVEVGFEALTPAYLALARTRAGQAPGDALDEARALVARAASPFVGEAFAILEAGCSGRGQAMTTASAASSEVRRALALVGARGAMRILGDAREVVLPDGRRLDLARRKNVRLLVVALARARRDQPGTAVDAEALVRVGWPGERLGPVAASKRLHTAIWTLRSLGFEGLLASSEAGYLFDPTVGIVFES